MIILLVFDKHKHKHTHKHKHLRKNLEKPIFTPWCKNKSLVLVLVLVHTRTYYKIDADAEPFPFSSLVRFIVAISLPFPFSPAPDVPINIYWHSSRDPLPVSFLSVFCRAAVKQKKKKSSARTASTFPSIDRQNVMLFNDLYTQQ